MSRREAENRVASQATEVQRRAIADVILEAVGTVAETLEAADALWTDVSERARTAH